MKASLSGFAAAAGLALVAACTPSWTGMGNPEPTPSTVATRPTALSTLSIFRTASGARIGFDELVARLSQSDVLVFGEQHDDPETHFAEFALLEALGRAKASVTLSLEMFERDVQQPLTRYVQGELRESEFLSQSRPWDRYATDYRPMVQLARARGWVVIAANAPRLTASAVSRQGLRVLDTIPGRQYVAAQLECAHDAYFDRFAEEMTGHAAGGGPPTASDTAQMRQMTERFYEAQCIKDETMAESITRTLAASSPFGPGSKELVFHVTGSFHSDYRQGTVQRVLRRAPRLVVGVVTAIPVDDPATAMLGDNSTRADFVIFTRKPPAGK
jgi:uncharacterized iron-regulated protein